MSRCRFAVWGLALLTVVALTLPAKPAEAVKIGVNDDYFVKLNFLTQPQFQITAPTDGETPVEWGFYLRRTRILLGGQVSKWVVFFMETDISNWGKGGDWKPDFIVQDAFVTFQIHDAFRISTGMLLLPFTHHFRQSAVSLVTLDYHVALAKYPSGSHAVWRDMGIEFGGVVLDGHLDYRVAVTNGTPLGHKTTDAVTGLTTIDFARPPRFTGRIGTNILDPDAGFFYGGTSLGKKKVMSGGFSFDVQPDAFGSGSHYYALAGDVVLDMPINDILRISGQAAFLHYGGEDNPTGGTGFMFDFAVGIKNFQPVVLMVDWFRPTASTDFDTDHFEAHYGAGWFIHGHNANVKLDIAVIRSMAVLSVRGTVQTQLFF
jgi:hypothetical protein